ncbi:unknown [Firmicutes bacterium CAG:137]|nr:unknown [Firmicutes bacterium CAG:137]
MAANLDLLPGLRHRVVHLPGCEGHAVLAGVSVPRPEAHRGKNLILRHAVPVCKAKDQLTSGSVDARQLQRCVEAIIGELLRIIGQFIQAIGEGFVCCDLHLQTCLCLLSVPDAGELRLGGMQTVLHILRREDSVFHLEGFHRLQPGISGAAAIGYHRIHCSRPYAFAHISHQFGGKSPIRVGHSVKLIGHSVKIGQIQHGRVILCCHGHGAVHVILSIPREIQVGKRRLKVAQAGTVAFAACIYVNFPWDTGIVHSKEQLRLVGHTILVLVVCFAQRGHSHKAIRSRVLLQIRGHVKGPLADCHGILRRQEQVGDYRRNLGAGSCGEDLAILHIPQRNACGVLRRGQGFASIQGNPMHGPGVCLSVHQIELPVGAVIGQGGQAGIQGQAWGPGILTRQIPGIQHGVALFVLQRAVHRAVHRGYCHLAGGRDLRRQGGGGGDHALALFNGRDNALGIHHSNPTVRRSPLENIGNPWLHCSLDGTAVTLGELQLRGIQGNGFRLLPAGLANGNPIGCQIHGIVIGLDQNPGLRQGAQVERGSLRLGLHGLIGDVTVQQRTGGIVDRNGRKIPVVPCLHGQLAV